MTDDELRRTFREIADQLSPSTLTVDEVRLRRSRGGEPPRPGPTFGRSRLVALAAVAAGLLVAVALATREPREEVGIADPADQPTTTASVSGTAAPTTTTSSTITSPRFVLVETLSDDEATITLTMVDLGGGGSRRELAVFETVPDLFGAPRSPVLDADVGPDGTAYVAVRAAQVAEGGVRPGGSRLLAYSPEGQERTLLENVESVRISPDGSVAAAWILSPDGNGDGVGTSALRLIDLTTRAATTLLRDDVPLAEDGSFIVDFDAILVGDWLPDGSAVVIEKYCCDSGSVIVVPADGTGEPAQWPTVRGTASTLVLGLDPQGDVLVQRSSDEEGGIEVVALDPATGATSPPLASATTEGRREARYDLVGTEVEGALLQRGQDATELGPVGLEGTVVRIFH